MEVILACSFHRLAPIIGMGVDGTTDLCIFAVWCPRRRVKRADSTKELYAFRVLNRKVPRWLRMATVGGLLVLLFISFR